MRKISLCKRAKRTLSKMKKSDRALSLLIAKRINKLSIDPLPKSANKLSGYDNLFRVRIGKYRIIYQFTDEVLFINSVGKRENIYDSLESITNS